MVSVDTRRKSISENGAHFTDQDVIRRTSDTEQVVYPSTDSTEDPEAWDTIMVGVAGVGGTLVPHGMD